MDRNEIAGCTVPEARALLARLPDMLKGEAMMLAGAMMGGKR